MMTRRLLLSRALSLSGLAALLSGCGGGRKGASPAAGERSIVVAVRWPERTATRLIPRASNSIEVVVRRGGEAVSRVVMDRPAAGGESRATLGRLPAGALTATATAYPRANASGVAQAKGQTRVNAVAGTPVTIVIEMDSTVDHIDVEVDRGTLFLGDTAAITATPRDAAGNVVLVADTLRWSVNTSRVEIDERDGRVTARAPGDAEVTVEETESGVRGSATIRVRGIGRIEVGPSPALLLEGDYFDLGAVAYDTDGNEAYLSEDAWFWDVDNAGVASVFASGPSALVSGSGPGRATVRVRTVAGGEREVPVRVYESSVSGSLSARRSGYDGSGTLTVSASDISLSLGAGATSDSASLSGFAVADSRTVLVELSGTDDTFEEGDSVDFTLELDGPQTEQGRSFFVFSGGSTSVSGSLSKTETSQTFSLYVRDPITGDTRVRKRNRPGRPPVPRR